MNVLSIIVLVMVNLVGFSSGVTLARKSRPAQIHIIDLVLVVILWIGAFGTRDILGHWAVIGVWLVVALLVGYIKTLLIYFDTVEIMPESELPEHARQTGEHDKNIGLLRRMWRGWTHFAERMGNVQGRLLMSFFYFIVVTPFALFFQLFNDPLQLQVTEEEATWQPKEQVDLTLREAREQG